MGNPRAFLTIHRQEAGYRPVHERIDDFSEVEQTLNSGDRRTQASRCMDCGVPFCHWACPLGNKQPEWQDLLYKGRYKEAYHVLEQTDDFPEFTGRVCPALCEKSCVLKLSCDEPVTIRENEAAIVEAAFREGYVQPIQPVRNRCANSNARLRRCRKTTKYLHKNKRTMGNPRAFLTIHRQEAGYRPVHERIDDFSEVEQTLNSGDRRTQASRCMDCGVPFCHWACPLGNKQPEWQDLLYKGRYKEAYHVLEQTDDFPEFTGRVCPALCEKSCVLKLSCDEPVTIRENEAAIVEAAFREGYVQPIQPVRNGKKVAVIGSGPAGLTVANQLNRKGYEVTVFEKDELPGGLLRFGIPNFKLGKHIIDRRIRIMEQEGILFRVNTMVGKEILAKDVVKDFDAVCVAIGAEVPRDLSIEGRHLRGVHFALELLSQQNRILEGIPIPPKSQINCKGKKVLVIGGGDTGSDCVGTANRHGAACVTQIEIMPQPPVGQNPATPWPMYPQVLKTSSSHEEGCIRRWNLASNRFIGEKNNLIGVEVEEVEWVPSPDGGRPQMRQTGKKEIIEADLVFLAMGFLHPEQEGLIKELRLATDNRDNIAVDNAGYTANSNLFACGDAVSGASLVVKAMASGRNVARSIDRFLQTN